MIHVKIDDTIIDLIQKVEEAPKGDIMIEVPLGHPILHNYISLKILKNKVGKKRRCVIITSDKLSKKIGQDLGIEYSFIRSKDFIEKKSPQELMQYNFSAKEYIVYQVKSLFSKGKTYISKKTKNLPMYQNSIETREHIPLNFIFFIFLFSISLFLFIYYIAVNKTFITIHPEIIVRQEALNFTFSEKKSSSILENRRNIQVEKITKIVELRKNYSATKKESVGNAYSQGKIRIYNNTNQKQALVPKTRFANEEGIVYSIDSWVQVPAGVTDNFGDIEAGYIDVIVRAHSQDLQGNAVGKNADIPKDTQLMLPGLSEEFREKIYAISLEDFTGGSDEYVRIIQQEDIENAKNILKEELRKLAINAIEEELAQKNIPTDVEYEIITLPGTLNYDDVQIYVVDDLKAGDKVESFELQGIMKLEAYMYNKNTIIQRLRNRINDKKLENIEKIIPTNLNTLTIDKISQQDSPFQVKATVSIDVISQYDFLHKNNTYTQELAKKIRGVKTTEAEKILLNDPYISSVHIKNRPFFRNKISHLPRNIYFEVQDNE